ncbi:helix-turn-helix domain-containing protein [Dyella flagellata]|uniref:helix-turn-helix domain-containing protein n=1 Tax=Dyella flagellata TaxID=1867833 RepID=UPI0024E150A1|nr:helix-turn-helix transcriptional regulator [Dyella flagellata]
MLNQALRMAREFHRLTQADLAARLDISASYLSEIENGKKRPSLDILDGYARIFGVPASTFLLFEERSNGKAGDGKASKAEKLLKFFDWVLNQEADDEAHGAKKERTPRTTQKAIRT